MTEQKAVNEVCREWSVREDNALAYQLQQLEVEQHYSGNKSRNAIVRQDCVLAKDAQRRAQEEAFEVLKRKALREEKDAQIAREIAEKFEREEREKLRRLEAQDQRIAKQIQEKEKKKKGDFNSVGLPIPEINDVQNYRLEGHYDTVWPPVPDKSEQEKLDEELAKRLQMEEETNSHLDRDRLLAIEVQDTELAKMLHQKEKARLKKVREKAKEKAALKKQMEEEMKASSLPSTISPISHIPNIAMAIDPTYVSPQKSSNQTIPFGIMPPTHLLVHPDILCVDDEEAPPYMPVQGQKRTPTDKKKKK